jgi:hypothetical protein
LRRRALKGKWGEREEYDRILAVAQQFTVHVARRVWELCAAAAASGTPGAAGFCGVVKFVPGAFFNQTKGAEVLRRLARAGACDASLVEEYILLLSSHAVVHYAQLCLGAGLARNTLALDVNADGHGRRGTLWWCRTSARRTQP